MCRNTYSGEDDYLSHVYVFENVLVSEEKIYSSKFYFRRGGCFPYGGNLHDSIFVSGFVDEAMIAFSYYARVFYHQFTEFVVSLLLLRPIIVNNPQIPILIQKNTMQMEAARKMAQIHHLHTKYISVGHEAIMVRRLIVPVIPVCGYTPKHLYQKIRDHVHKAFEITDYQKPTKILLGQRYGERHFVEFDDYKSRMEQLYPNLVEVFEPNEWSVDEIAKKFSRAMIFVSPHGSGMTNMVFMHKNTTVVELLPDQWAMNFFKDLALAFDLQFDRIVVQGTKNSWISIGSQGVDRLVDMTVAALNNSPHFKNEKASS